MRCTALLVLAATGMACESRALVETPTSDESFVAVARQSLASRDMMTFAPAKAVDPGDSFYLAIHKRELGQRWFLSAYLTQYFPDAVLGGAAASLGTRVVSFKIQNDKLVVFDVDDNKQSSDTFGVDTIVDAYPIVQVGGVRDDYVVIDPAAGLNRFGVLGDAFGRGGFDRFMVEVAFSQRFRRISDGVTWEQAFTGFTDKPYKNLDGTEANQFRASGVLGLALRRYQEGEGFTPVPIADDHYFTSNPFVVTNAGVTSAWATKWNIQPGMKPIRWLISPAAAAAADTPEVRAAGINLLGAIKQGIESWNSVFGYPVLEAAMASPEDSFGDDDKNYLIYDVNPAVQFAFADWRSNPNTGEIRGASVYFNDVFVQDAIAIFFPAPVAAVPTARTAEKPVRQLTWLPFDHPKLCHLRAADVDPLHEDVTGPGTPATAHERAEKYLAHVVAHEVGHTLGLRHNFKGSLVPPTSSIMDYVNTAEADAAPIPASYDAAAVLALYGGPAPTQPFCTDEGVGVDPLCEQFDAAADPLRTFFKPRYARYASLFLGSGTPLYSDGLDFYLNKLVQFAQLGTPADAADGYAIAVAPVKTPLDGDAIVAGGPGFTDRINDVSQRLFGRLVPVPDPMAPLPPLDAAVTGQLVPELTANLLNVDAIRSFPTRRLTVDVLKRLQLVEAYNGLRVARQTLVDATADDRALLDDLLARIDKAVTPYFDK